jgi:hypothetical protein
LAGFKEVDLQASTEEHEHDAELAPTAHGELAKLPHGYDNDDDIEDDVDGGRSPGIGIEVDAFSVMLAIPVFPGNAYGNALQRGCCDECDNVQNANHNRDVNYASEILMREDAEVEEQNCYLGQSDRRKVEKLSIVEDLSLHSH